MWFSFWKNHLLNTNILSNSLVKFWRIYLWIKITFNLNTLWHPVFLQRTIFEERNIRKVLFISQDESSVQIWHHRFETACIFVFCLVSKLHLLKRYLNSINEPYNPKFSFIVFRVIRTKSDQTSYPQLDCSNVIINDRYRTFDRFFKGMTRTYCDFT